MSIWSDIYGGENPRFTAWRSQPEVEAYTREQIRLSQEGYRPKGKAPPPTVTRAERDSFLAGFSRLGAPAKSKVASKPWAWEVASGKAAETKPVPQRAKAKAPDAPTRQSEAAVRQAAASKAQTTKGEATRSGWRPLSPTQVDVDEAQRKLLESLGL